jgi:cell division ATP-binding protein FtsE
LIDFINVEKTYKSGVEALKGVNFTIEDGEFVFIIGKSGSGKSTLLKCITCEETPTSGKVTIDNFDISHMSRALVPVLRRKIGMIYQDFRLIDSKTVAENVAFAGEIIGVPRQSLMNTVQICLSVVGLKDKADCYPQELSGGEQQRVAIARAMVNNPSLIVADEPTGNLDPETSEAIMAMLLELNQNGGTTVIICTHDSTMVDRMKQRVIEIEDGLITRDEKKSGYKGEQADAETNTPEPAKVSSRKVAFGDDEEYGDDYDDPNYESVNAETPNSGLVFGDTAGDAQPAAAEEKAPVSEEPAEEVIDAGDLPEEVISEDNDSHYEEFTEPEVIEINIPEKDNSISFGDEEETVSPDDAENTDAKEAPSFDDPDITPADEVVSPGKAADNRKELKRELKRKAREEKLAQKEAKRKEKLDKKNKPKKPGFAPENDIDIFPEDDE